jgi:hypothetical protein
MTESLRKYCEKHDYTIIEEYTTLGEERLNKRAIVKDNKTGEKYYLYFDPSRKRRSFTQQKRDYETYMAGNPLPIPPSRGWRNTTLDNRNREKRLHENRKDIS